MATCHWKRVPCRSVEVEGGDKGCDLFLVEPPVKMSLAIDINAAPASTNQEGLSNKVVSNKV